MERGAAKWTWRSTIGGLVDESMSIEVTLLLASLLLLGSVLASKISSRLGIPVLLVFLVIGMVAGVDGPGGIVFDDAVLTQNLAIIALTVILFSGGLDTDWSRVRPVVREASMLATLGVGLTSGLVAVFARYFLGYEWMEGLLLGSIVGSTDAAAVFSVLKSRGISLKGGSDRILELESGSNDPMAVFLTVGMTAVLAVPGSISVVGFLGLFLQQMLLGGLFGLGLGWLGSGLVNRLRLEYDGLYPPFLLSWAMIAYAVPALVGGSGFLSVYLAGIVIANRPLVHRKSLTGFFDGLAWLMQISMFLVLGLLVFPSRLPPLFGSALALSAFLILVARPIAVFFSLLGTGRSVRQKGFIAWVGLRGAVPIILATYPVVAGLEVADEMFHLVFFVVLTSVLLQGTTLDSAARWLGLSQPNQEGRPAVLSFDPLLPTENRLEEIVVRVGTPATVVPLLSLELPKGVLIILITRADGYIIPTGTTRLEPGDRALVLVEPAQSVEMRRLLCGKVE